MTLPGRALLEARDLPTSRKCPADIFLLHFSLILVHLIAATFLDSFILRNECMSDGQFVVSHGDKILEGAVLSTSHLNQIECQTACLTNDRCKSININATGGLGCQLNSKIAGDNGTNFIEKKGWTYKTTNFSALQVLVNL